MILDSPIASSGSFEQRPLKMSHQVFTKPDSCMIQNNPAPVNESGQWSRQGSPSSRHNKIHQGVNSSRVVYQKTKLSQNNMSLHQIGQKETSSGNIKDKPTL